MTIFAVCEYFHSCHMHIAVALAAVGQLCGMEHIVNKTCRNSSGGSLDAIFWLNLGTLSLSCLANFAATLIVVCGGSYKKLIVRSVLYFLIANLLLTIFSLLGIIPTTLVGGHFSVKSPWWNVCSAIGFLVQTTAWMRDLRVLATSAHAYAHTLVYFGCQGC